MKKWIFAGCTPILGGLQHSTKSGQIPRRAKYIKKFASTITGEISQCTDLEQTKNKRRKKFVEFHEKYKEPVKQNLVTIFSGVVKTDEYPDFSKFISNFKKKFKREEIAILGYVWTRDVGDKKFERHVHFLIATSKISGDTFRSLFSKKKHSKYEIQIAKKVSGMVAYLKKKEVFSDNRQRAWGASRYFRSLKNNFNLVKSRLNTKRKQNINCN